MKTTIVTPLLLILLGLPALLVPVSSVHGAEAPQLQIEGVSGDALHNVSVALRLPGGLVHDGAVSRLWLKRYLRLAPAKVARALEPFGYYASEVEIKVDREAQPLRIRVRVMPGPPVRVDAVDLQVVGPEHLRLQRLVARFPLPPGEVLQHAAYEQFKAELQGAAVDLGYLDAKYSRHQVRVDRASLSARIDLVLETGPRYRFGPFSISGGDDYPERFLRRYITVRPGEAFSYAELGKVQQHFLDSDRFSSVVIAPQIDQASDTAVPVEIRLKERPPKRLRPGVGYGTDTGARFFLRYQDVNAWQLGHEFTSDLLLAERKQALTANYLFPGYRNLDTAFGLHGGYTAEQLETYDTRYVFAEVEQLYGFAERRVGSVFVRFQEETSTISGSKLTSRVVMPGVRFRLGRLDDPARPRSGYRLSLEARGTWDELGSDVSLLQLIGDLNWITPLPWRTYLRLRGNAAISLQQNAIDEVPASLRFFAGGDQSVRGYVYQSLGPTNSAGEVVGGKHRLVGSVELEKRFLDNWGAAIFYDAGNAFNSLSDYDLAEAAGVGLLYYTPVGPARLDLARTLDAEKVGYRVHIGLGVGW